MLQMVRVPVGSLEMFLSDLMFVSAFNSPGVDSASDRNDSPGGVKCGQCVVFMTVLKMISRIT